MSSPFPPQHTRWIFIAGPTAVGKSAIALEVADRINGQIISVDSMQVYRGLDIGTAKPSLAERQRIPHHLIDILELHESFDAARFCEFAQQAIAHTQSRGRIPVFCGGTGFYYKAFRDGLGDAPPANEALRKELENTPPERLLDELQQRDPATFETIDRKNLRRVIRALEVIRLTHKPFSAQRADWKQRPTSPTQQEFGLLRSQSDLRSRIDQRVDDMFARGLIAETESLLKAGLANNQTALQAIGYRQVVEYLHGQRTLPDTIELVKIRTRQFAKRQMTWFKRQIQLRWLPLQGDHNAAVETISRSITEL